MVDVFDKSIVICSIVRDAARQLERNIPVIENLCRHFAWYRVVIYENDSVDRTAQVLERWKANDSRVHVISETLHIRTIPEKSEVSCNPFFSAWRIEKMSQYRNHYLDYIDYQGWTPDYLMVVDLDVQKIFGDGILSSFASGYDWDVVTAFGYSLSPRFTLRYHDAYALVECGKENSVQTEKSIRDTAYTYASRRNGSRWERVYSAFGGLSIFKYERMKGLRYCALLNGDSRVEARSEHFGLFRQMYERGELKVYLNPEMKLHYQILTPKIVLRRISRSIIALFR